MTLSEKLKKQKFRQFVKSFDDVAVTIAVSKDVVQTSDQSSRTPNIQGGSALLRYYRNSQRELGLDILEVGECIGAVTVQWVAHRTELARLIPISKGGFAHPEI